MLVVSRKTGESLMVGDDVEIKVVAIGRDFVRLGINAPRNIPVHRHEVFLSLKQEKKPAEEEENED